MPPSFPIRPPLTGETLVHASGELWLPYDLAFLDRNPADFVPLSQLRPVLNAHHAPFRLDIPAPGTLHLLNGMGVALGDSVIGLSVLDWLHRERPDLALHMYRSPHTPAYVEALYALVPWLATHYLPRTLADFDHGVLIDLADFMYRPAFDRLPMIDFFLDSLGLDPARMPPVDKANRWLRQVMLPTLPEGWPRDYLLLCPDASSPLRRMPANIAADIARELIACGHAVLGFGALPVPGYRDISAWAVDLRHLLAALAGATGVIATDSAPIHLAAGFDRPCLAFFMGIDPALRVRDYPHCQPVQLDHQARLAGLHHADTAWQLEEAAACWAAWRDALSVAMPANTFAQKYFT
ncbi:glycosyltransferase family 9 protein [Chitiniphilus eburneus]|uniref:ADP-heptose--LPS heptosyltransferase n=1 Tax=Chitiniphilus eburneus TaxID=2571148 RepID=A0A4V5MQV6_9NEIS|nr:glycosyltransferase family 9 protein [Chitiniphilus eburneus]TJZ66658.1 ADP-heptose--LPS heptosyltransferase [Chitiniphilus eburneus]